MEHVPHTRTALEEQIPEITSLESCHSWLYSRICFLQNRYGAGRPVYLIEHGLPERTLQLMLGILRERLSVYRLTTDELRWRGCYLPLLVLATENGHRYGGSNQEFWSTFEAELEHSFSAGERRALEDWFRAIEPITHVRPPQSRWAQWCRHIAWPITHAVLPLRLQVPLLQATRSLDLLVTEELPQDELLEPVRAWAAQHSPPLAYLLDDADLSEALIKGFLFDDYTSQRVSPALLARIRRDLRDSQHALQELREARERQSYLRRRRISGQGAPSGSGREQKATLRLRIGGRRVPELCMVLPSLSASIAEEVIRAERRLRLRPLGARRGTTARSLVQGQEVRVRVRQLPAAQEGGTPIFDDLKSADCAGISQLELHLRSQRLDLRRPLLFSARDPEAPVATQLRSHNFHSEEVLWLLLEQRSVGQLPPGVTSLGTACALHCYRADARNPQAWPWLQALGLEQLQRPKVAVLSMPSRSGPRSETLVFSKSDPAFLVVSGGDTLCLDEDSERTLTEGVWRLRLAEGEQVLRLQAAGGRPEDLLLACEEPLEPLPAVRIDIRGESLSVEALQRKALSVTVEGLLPLEGLPLRLSLWGVRGRLAAVDSPPLPALPHTVAADDPLWELLLQAADQTRRDWAHTEAWTLRAEVGGVADAQVWLEPDQREQWWRQQDDHVELIQEDEALEVFLSAAAHPAILSASLPSADGSAILHQPCQISAAGAPLPVPGLGLCVRLGRSLRLDSAPQRPRRLIRQLKGSGQKGAVGAHSLTMAWLSWATASGDDLLSEGLRRRAAAGVEGWLVEVMCGRRWQQLEAYLLSEDSPSLGARMMARLEAEPELEVIDGYFLEMLQMRFGEAAKEGLRAALLRCLESAEDLLVALADEPDEHIEEIEVLLNEAHTQAALSLLLEEGAVLEEDQESDIAVVEQETLHLLAQEEVEQWRQQERLEQLRQHIHPPGMARTLSALDVHTLSFSELVAEVHGWLKSRPRSIAPWSWDVEQIRLLLTLWLRPKALSPESSLLTETLTESLRDRAASRAVRYVALRWRRAGRTGA